MNEATETEMSAVPSIDQIQSDFELLEDWEDRYRYVIELGRELPAFPDAQRNEANKVRGCTSQVWLVVRHEPGPDGSVMLVYDGDSDAHIVRGLVAILLAIYSGKTPEQILAIDAHTIFKELGLNEHLTPQRSNGLASMVMRIREDARRSAQ